MDMGKTIRRGDRFTHKRVLASSGDGMAICTVSRVAKDVIYYLVEDERRAKSYFSLDQQERVVNQWLTP